MQMNLELLDPALLSTFSVSSNLSLVHSTLILSLSLTLFLSPGHSYEINIHLNLAHNLIRHRIGIGKVHRSKGRTLIIVYA